MKRAQFIILFSLLLGSELFSNGVCIKDATEAIYFRLNKSEISVNVYSQVSILSSTQTFINNTNGEANIKYAFPLYEDASPTSLRWFVNGIWNTASFAPSPQDTTLPGGGDIDPNLLEYLGDTPLFFNVPDTIQQDSTIIFELTYVQLLPYDFGIVEFRFPNNYLLIQNEILEIQTFHLTLESNRIIENIELSSHENATISNTGNFAEVYYEDYEHNADQDYLLIYQLNLDELGLFSFSTFLPDSTNECDDLGNGFLAYVVEPDPNDSLEVIQKVFTLILDRSGSMSGDKIVQARNAASFIVNNLNEGDYFNIVTFNSSANTFSDDHVEFNSTTQELALQYIASVDATGSTNISEAFSYAIEDFSGNDTTIANIVIFFTDGQATAGIISTEGILAHIHDQLNYWEVNYLMIHTFGIGEDVNQQLLSQISFQNNGMTEFLMDNELEEIITNFYLRIRNPVLVNTELTFDPPLISESFPDPIPNLYLGQQLIMVGRYEEADSVTAIFNGDAFGQSQTYSYGINLADSLIEDNLFLVKIWAKKKIEYLYVQYFTFPQGSPEAEEIKEEIIDISVCYNVLSPFTHFTGGGGISNIEFDDLEFENEENLITYNFPNPFNKETRLYLDVNEMYFGKAEIKIYDMFGRLLKILEINITGPGEYNILWDGKNHNGTIMAPGHFFYVITYDHKSVKGRMIKY